MAVGFLYTKISFRNKFKNRTYLLVQVAANSTDTHNYKGDVRKIQNEPDVTKFAFWNRGSILTIIANRRDWCNVN